jgi:hypothetical protein
MLNSAQIDHLEFKKAKELVKQIIDLPGDKMVSVVTDESRVFDISELGSIGYEPEHEQLFVTMITKGLLEGGVLTIRQFTKLQTQVQRKNEKVFVPIKNIFGVLLGEKSYKFISAREMEMAHRTAADGSILPKEQAIRYIAFPTAI